ncbi:MAG: LLM class flavin-dependent oxidoreductase, partial [Candidatus Odinarchaeia archaeon]
WKLARETVTLDYISNGRLIQGIGIGSPREIKSNPFGEESDPKKLARRLDEAAEILIKFWSGKPFTYNGEYYQIDEVLFSPKPLQKPRIPIWVAGTWPHKAPFKRAAKYEGVVPINSKWPKPLTPEMLRDVLSIIKENRGSLKNYDVAVSGVTSGKNTKQDREKLLSYISEGANWWIEDIYEVRGSLENLLTRIRDGPPVV